MEQVGGIAWAVIQYASQLAGLIAYLGILGRSVLLRGMIVTILIE